MRCKGFFSAIMLVWSLLMSIAVYGDTYYVAPGGNDLHPGTLAQPWRTITKAAQTLIAGDTVSIRAGTYPEQVTPQNSGSSGQPIVYAAYPGETVTIDGYGITLPDEVHGLFHIANKSYLKVSGLRLINAGPYNNNAGIIVTGSQYITIEKNYTSDTQSSGIGVWESTNIVIDGNEVTLAGISGWQECISIAQTGFFAVKHNHVYNGSKEGIDAKQGSHDGAIYQNHVHDLPTRLGIYVDAYDQHTYNIDVYQNRVHHNGGHGFALAAEAGGLLENIRVYNNLAYQNGLSGICLIHEPSATTQPVNNVTIINNTFYQNGDPTGWGGGIAVENQDGEHVDNIVIRNNACSQNVWFQIQVEIDPPHLTIDHNLVYGTKGYAENDGTPVVEADPLFLNPAAADFHLQSASPAINQGSATAAPAVDFDGQARPQSGVYDIGAYEFRSVNAYLLWTK